jgi:lysyl-tRNA synthetase class 2
VRRTLTPALLAYAAAFVGAVGIVSALTPELANRSELVQGILPPGIPEAARVLTISFGIGLLWLSRGLTRRKRRAWQLAVVLVVASAVTHLAKGLDFEEATGAIVLLALLWRSRRAFAAPGDPEAVRPLLHVFVALVVLAPLALVWSADLARDTLGALALALGARALFLWLRPIAELRSPTAAERRHAAELVRAYGGDSLAYFALRQDKSTFFSASGRSFLAYRVIAGTALVTGDPVGDPSERRELVAEFRRIAHTQGWRIALAGVAAETLPEYAELGFQSIYLGDEAVVDPVEFSLEGRRIRKVRQSVSRLRAAGYTVEVLSPADADDALRAQLQEVSCAWRGAWPERGFAMAMDALFAYADARLAVAVGPDGRVGGFLQLVPAPASGGYSLATMRRRPETPNGLMEFLIVATIEWARGRGVTELSLNFSVFGEHLRADGGVLRALLLRLDRIFQLERLHAFNGKFFPTWRPRYVCFASWTDLPFVAFAYLHAESLLTPPGPWARSEDLAAR